jgi:hypothetical protein
MSPRRCVFGMGNRAKNITFPTDVKLLHATIKGLTGLAREHGVRLRQSYVRIAKRAAMRYAHAKQFNRHRRQLRILRRLGRIIRDIRRKIAGHEDFEAAFAWPLSRANQIRSQQQRQRGWKLYSFHAPEVEGIGKGKASAAYEFGVKASVVTTNARTLGGQFVLHVRTLPGNPYDGHTLGAVIEATQRLTGREIEHAYVDAANVILSAVGFNLSRMAEGDFARRPPRATSDLRNPTSRQTSFLTGDHVWLPAAKIRRISIDTALPFLPRYSFHCEPRATWLRKPSKAEIAVLSR